MREARQVEIWRRSSRFMRRSRLSVNAAVTPAASL